MNCVLLMFFASVVGDFFGGEGGLPCSFKIAFLLRMLLAWFLIKKRKATYFLKKYHSSFLDGR